MNLIDIPGIGEKTVAVLEKHGVLTTSDLLSYFPRTYRTYLPRSTRTTEEGEWVSLVGTMSRPVSHHTTHTTTQLSTFKDPDGAVTLRWFNMPYITRSVDPEATYLVRGQLTIFGSTRQIVSPQISKVPEGYVAGEELVAIYTPIGTLKSGSLRKIIGSTLDTHPAIEDPLAESLRLQYDLLDLKEAFEYIHRPPTRLHLEGAIHRLAFDELYSLQLEALEKSELNKIKTEPMPGNADLLNHWIAGLPYRLTSAQSRVIHEICTDLGQPTAMRRLLAGEVGSGKTVVAGAAALVTYLSGHQTLVMAPTQILAEQLFASFTKLLGNVLTVSLVTASTKGSLAADIVVGTQALLSPKHKFGKVGLVIVDEQHRFGVKQREYLGKLTPAPHLLMMTATPIPRTLAMTLFANMAISRLDELPANRLPTKTYVVGEEKREAAYAWIKQEIVTQQNQVFVVVPLIEEAEDEEGNAKKSISLLETDLKSRFPDLVIDIMHGKMKDSEKTVHLQAFRDGMTHILVATSMIEVGIDIPEGNIMVIEDAERFGLAQLHQLRGRVGRGRKQGYCLLFSKSQTPKVRERLAFFVREVSGEKLAAYDLEHRGPGELFGESQHGFFSLRFASIADTELLQQTYETALHSTDK